MKLFACHIHIKKMCEKAAAGAAAAPDIVCGNDIGLLSNVCCHTTQQKYSKLKKYYLATIFKAQI